MKIAPAVAIVVIGFIGLWLANQKMNHGDGRSASPAHSPSWKDMAWPEDANATAIRDHKVRIGMTQAQCREAWGKPYDTNRTVLSDNSVREQWVYGSIDYGMRFLYFEDGVLVTIQN